MIATENGNGMVMPVAPMGGFGYGYGYGNGGGGGFGNDFGGAWWLLVLFLFALNGNNGWGNGSGGGNMGIPFMMNNYTNSDLQRGFDQQTLTNGISGVANAINNGFTAVNSNLCNGFAGVNQNLCSGFAGVNQGVAQGFASAEIADNARQIANMQTAFNSQTAITGGLTNLQSQLAQCCCDNRLATANLQSTILAENCADRAAVSDGVRDLLVNNTANTQRLVDVVTQSTQGVYDKLCQLELDAKNDKIAELQRQLTAAETAKEFTAQTAAVIANNNAQTAALEDYLNPVARPAYIVQNPNCCNQGCYNGCGYGVA